MPHAGLSKGFHPVIVLIAGLIMSISILAVIGSYSAELRVGKAGEVSHGSDVNDDFVLRDELPACERSGRLERVILPVTSFPVYTPIKWQATLLPDNLGTYDDILHNYGRRGCDQECREILGLSSEEAEEPRVNTPVRSRLLISQWGLQNELEPVLKLAEQRVLIENWDPSKYDMVIEDDENKILDTLFLFQDTMRSIDSLIYSSNSGYAPIIPSSVYRLDESRRYEAVTREIDAFDERIEHAFQEVCKKGYYGTYKLEGELKKLKKQK